MHDSLTWTGWCPSGSSVECVEQRRRRRVGREVETQHWASVLGEHGCVSGGLSLDELTEGERPAGDLHVGRRVGGDLQEHADGGAALVVLPRGVQEARTPPEGDGAGRLLGEGRTGLGEAGGGPAGGRGPGGGGRRAGPPGGGRP